MTKFKLPFGGEIIFFCVENHINGGVDQGLVIQILVLIMQDAAGSQSTPEHCVTAGSIHHSAPEHWAGGEIFFTLKDKEDESREITPSALPHFMWGGDEF